MLVVISKWYWMPILMLEKSDTNVADSLAVFNGYELEVGLLVPTKTGLEKSIMDATRGFRQYLAATSFHDYEAQAQGAPKKIIKKAFFVWPDRLEETKVSLYRPSTKKGDPRIWFSRLSSYASPWNLLAILVLKEIAYVINCSDKEILASIHQPKTPLGSLAAVAQPKRDGTIHELLNMVREVAARGYVPTMRAGATGVGMTLETLLGIPANSRQQPDYKGIELKAKRMRHGKNSRVTLFSQVPNWRLSPIGSAWNLLSSFGYERDGKLRLNHEINAAKPNSLGFFLELSGEQDRLKQSYVDPGTSKVQHLTTWEMKTLRGRLVEKHPQTFWVAAKCRGRGEREEFHYVQVEHTRGPRVRNFEALIEAGVISVDYLLSQKGSRTVRDHGYLFKIHGSDFPALFPPSKIYPLV